MSKQRLPEQVRKQSEEIQALYADMEMDGGDNGKLPGETPVATEHSEALSDGGEATLPANNERKEAGKSKKDEGKEDWKQKYLSLQGMYNTEMPKLKGQNHDLQQRISNLESLLAGEMSQKKAPATAALEVRTGSIVTADDVKEYAEAIDVMRRVTQEEIQPLIVTLNNLQSTLDNLNSEVVPKVNQVYSSQASTVEQKFWDKIASAIPDWQDINNSPDFATWLYQNDLMTGRMRQDILEEAQVRNDADRVIYIFRAWMGETGYDSGNSKNDYAHADNTELESQVAPGRGRSNKHKGEPDKQKYTRAAIKEFYKKVADGKFKGRDDERKKIEADIFAAQREGRVVD